jgi:hypothetical protein
VSRTESWIFAEDLTYENRNESYEGYVSPFGGGYSRPRSSSRGGLWAPSDHPSSPFSIITIADNGFCANQSVAWPDPTQANPRALDLEGVRFGRM